MLIGWAWWGGGITASSNAGFLINTVAFARATRARARVSLNENQPKPCFKTYFCYNCCFISFPVLRSAMDEKVTGSMPTRSFLFSLKQHERMSNGTNPEFP